MGTEDWNELEREVKREDSVSVTEMNKKNSKDNTDKWAGPFPTLKL